MNQNQKAIKSQLRKAENNLLTAVAVIRDAKRGDEISERQIKSYCDEALRAVAEVETIRFNAKLSKEGV